MKLKSFAAAAVSAVLTFTSVCAYPCVNAETTPGEEITLTYNYTGEYLGNPVTAETPENFASYTVTPGDSIIIAEGELECEGSTFMGWTYDGLFLFQEGDVFVCPTDDFTLEPVWVKDKEDGDPAYSVSYNVVIDGEVQDMSKDLWINRRPGMYITISNKVFQREGYTQIGWLYDGKKILPSDKFIMPDHDVVFEPNWLKRCYVTYDAGDVDRIKGNSSYTFDKMQDLTFELADKSRLTRNGFDLSGWICSDDNQIYLPLSYYTMPDHDVTFYAYWTPKTYNVVFMYNNGTSTTVKVAGETDSAIICPECNGTKAGYKFAGWNFNGTVYQAGEEFIIPGASAGTGISLKGVWVEDTAPVEDEFDVFDVIEARKKSMNGEGSADDVKAANDFILMR